MRTFKKNKLKKQLAIFLSTCVFSGAGFYFTSVAYQAAPVFKAGTGIDSTIAGIGLIASGMSSTAVGFESEATEPHATAVGSDNHATGQFSLAAGYKNTASETYAIAVGGNNVSSGRYSVTLGVSNKATYEISAAVGHKNTASGNTTSAFGYSNTASKQSSSAFGHSNEASGNRASAFGYTNTASARYANAFGHTNKAIGENANAFGYLNTASAEASSAFGYTNEASGDDSSAFGADNTASGEGSSAFGYTNTASGLESSAFGYRNIASGESASAVGYLNEATGVYASAFGRDNTASGRSSSAFGADNTASGEFASAFGRGNTASGGISNAFGALNNVSGARSNAFGYANTVKAARSTAIGESNNIDSSAIDSFALGNKISITLKDSVALGNNSKASAINIVTGHSSSSKWAGVNDVVGVVSVGAAGSTRQIQNVAAGTVSATSTDAINGSQLYAVAQQAAAQATVSAGDSNVVVTPTTNSSGGTDYEVKLADDLEVASSIDVGNGGVVIDGDNKTITTGDIVIDGANNAITVDKITIDGDAGTIGGLTNTDWDPDNYVTGQAATEDQLKAISDELADVADLAAAHNTVSNTDGNIKIIETQNADKGTDYELALSDELQIGSDVNIDGNAGKIDLGNGNIVMDGANSTISTGNIKLDGSSDTITAGSVTIDGGAGTIGGLTNTTWDADNITSGQGATEDQLKAVSDSAVKYDIDSSGNVDNSKITLGGSGGTTITNVAAGEVSATSTDAVKGSQLHAVKQDISSINNDISKLGDEIDSVGALSAAMAGLHPRFQDGNKGEFAMAVGGYGGKSAVAMGGFYAPNEKVMFSLGLGVSEGGRKMGNFGVNFALDRSRDRTKEPRDILYSRKEVDANIAEQDEKIRLLLAKLEEQNNKLERQSLEIEMLKEKLDQ